MKLNSISPLNFNKNNTLKSPQKNTDCLTKSIRNGDFNAANYPKFYYINQISFGVRKPSANEITERIGEENFPSPAIVKRLKDIGKSSKFSLYEIHMEHYEDLLDCQTLDEAKEKYPEFKDVIDAKDIDINSLKRAFVLKKIANGEIEGIAIEDLSLEILKKYFGQLISANKKEEYWNISNNAIPSIAKTLNIKLPNKMYMLKTALSSGEYKARMSKTITEKMQEPEYKEKMERVYRASKLAWNRHPEITDMMSEVAKDFPWLAVILSKKEKGIELNQKEERYLFAYCGKCEEAMPGYKKIISDERRKILAEWDKTEG